MHGQQNIKKKKYCSLLISSCSTNIKQNFKGKKIFVGMETNEWKAM